jgi:hypothetical protein
METDSHKSKTDSHEAKGMQKTALPASRRAFLKRCVAAGAAGLGAGTFLTACGSGEQESSTTTCVDPSTLTEAEKQQRQNFGYVAQTPNPDQRCNNCQFWQPDAADGDCGGCQLFPGPVNPKGWCNSWAQGSGGGA